VRLRLAGDRTVHLGYCYNVLPGETVETLIEQLRRICGPVRARLGVARLGIGLWIARPAATELRASAAARRSLASTLAAEGLYVFTLNGFPYGGFHAPRVKERVFEPTWAEQARLDYTIDLAEILAELLPDDIATGSISTLPLGPATVDRAGAAAGLRRCADALASIGARTGRQIELAVEPEPGAGFERTDELARFLASVGGGALGVCLDCCHAAVVDEDPATAFAALTAAGIRCAKIQISSALVVARPDDAAQRAALAEFDEPRFLHQVRSQRGGAMDLPEALASLDRSAPWRIHFHVPVHDEAVGGFATTRDSIKPVLEAALALAVPPHLEVETYTWNVLPAERRPRDEAGLVEGIAHELAWTLDQLRTLGATL
jgi:sugar phosphate isomerase/epimerase